MATSTTPASAGVSMPGHHHGAMTEPSATAAPMIVGGTHHMMTPSMQAVFYLATALAAAQILLNVLAVFVSALRVKRALRRAMRCAPS